MLRRRLKPSAPVVSFILTAHGRDGTTILQRSGDGASWDSNAWLAALTQQAFPAIFYAGDAWVSFN
jgi:hypothetical protein